MKKAGVIIMAVCAAAVAGVAAYVFLAPKQKGGPGQGFPGGGGASQQTVVSVRSIEAQPTVLHDYVNTNGEVTTQNSVEVLPDIGGTVVSVSVNLGSTVRRGQVLAEIDPSVPGTQYRHSYVTAPIDGAVTSSPVKRGVKVTTSSTIAVIGDVSNLQIVADIPERYVAALKNGLKANIMLEAYPGEVFTATVTRVSPLVDSTSRTKEIILNFDEKDERINAGMFAKVTLYTQDYADEVAVPSDAIVEVAGQQYLYVVVNNNTAERREVTTGSSVDNQVQILSGIAPGERVVVEGMRVLSHGSPVRDIAAAASEPAAPSAAASPERKRTISRTQAQRAGR